MYRSKFTRFVVVVVVVVSDVGKFSLYRSKFTRFVVVVFSDVGKFSLYRSKFTRFVFFQMLVNSACIGQSSQYFVLFFRCW